MEIKKGHNCFYIGETEETAKAKISYVPNDDNTITANSTRVGEELRGQGIAGELLDKLVDYAREEDLKIVPVCSYVQKNFEKSTYDDVKA